jgi:hypothetical protein
VHPQEDNTAQFSNGRLCKHGPFYRVATLQSFILSIDTTEYGDSEDVASLIMLEKTKTKIFFNTFALRFQTIAAAA